MEKKDKEILEKLDGRVRMYIINPYKVTKEE